MRGNARLWRARRGRGPLPASSSRPDRVPAAPRPRGVVSALLGTGLLLLALLPTGAQDATQTAPAARFGWPLEIDEGLSSTFGEYRTNHLHGGIDFRTRRESGYKVLAAADGEVYRIKVEWRGYGKTLYIRHLDDWVTVYAHLERFENDVLGLEDLAAVVEREKHTRYFDDYYLDVPLPVMRGQVVGYTGESGAGLPHLHFETRIGEFEQVNPFVAGLEWAGDRTRPTIVSATLIPEGAGASVLGGAYSRTIPFVENSHGFVWRQPVIVQPPLRLLVTAFDVEGTDGNTCHVYRLKVALDGRPLCDVTSDRFHLSQSLCAGLVFDLNRNGKYPVAFTYALDPRLSQYVPLGECQMPIRGLAEGLHRLEITAADYWGNESRAVGELYVPPDATLALGPAREADGGLFEVPWSITGVSSATPRIEISFDDGATFAAPSDVSVDAATGLLRFQAGNPLLSTRAIVRASVDYIPKARAVMSVDLLESPLSPIEAVDIDAKGRMTVRLKRGEAWSVRAAGFEPFRDEPLGEMTDASTSAVFDRPAWPCRRLFAQIEFPAREGSPFSSFLIPWTMPDDSFQQELVPGRNHVNLSVVFNQPQVEWDGSSRVRYADGTTQPLAFRAVDERRFAASFEPPAASGTAFVDVRGTEIPVVLRRVVTDESQRFIAGDMVLTFDPGSAYSDFFLWITDDQPYQHPRLRQVGTVCRIRPEGEPLARPVRMQIHYPLTVRDAVKLGIYSWDPGGFWVYEPTGIDRSHRLLSTSVMRLGRYVVLEDLARPTIAFVTPRPGRTMSRSGTRAVLVEIEDVGKGVDMGSIRISLDGHALPCEYDPDRHWAACFIPAKTRSGRHVLRVTARDLAGNYAIPASAAFYLK